MLCYNNLSLWSSVGFFGILDENTVKGWQLGVQKMRKLKKAWNVLTTIVVIIVVCAAVLLVGVRLIGLQPYTVLSGSMEPVYHTGSLIYVKEADYTVMDGN